MHIRNIGVSVLSLAMVCAACGSAFALNPVGPGEFIAAETAVDMSLAGQSFAVPANAATTNFPGVFCPRGPATTADYPEGVPTGVWQTVWRNVSLSDIETFTARIAHIDASNIGNSIDESNYVWKFTNYYLTRAAFKDAAAYHVTENGDGTVTCQFQKADDNNQTISCMKMTFRQVDADVEARIDFGKYASKNSTQSLGGDFNTFGLPRKIVEAPFYATSLSVADIGCILKDGVSPVLAPSSINFVNTDATAVEDESLTNVVRRYDACLELPWVKLWPNTRLSDVDVGAAQMIGTGSGGKWVSANAYLPALCLEGQGVSYYYQYYNSQYVRTAKVYFRQVGEDVWGRVLSVKHDAQSSNTLPRAGADGNSNGDTIVSITNDLNGVVTAHPGGSSYQIQTLKFQTATRPGKVQHTVTVDGGFNPRFVPLRLFETKLAIAPAPGETVTLGSPIYGYAGAIAGTGAGTVALNVDLPQFFSLEATSGRVRIDGVRTVGGELSVTSGGTLEFAFSQESAPLLAAASASFAPGARIVLSSGAEARLIAPDSVFTLVSGCGLSSSDIAGVSATCEGGMRRFRPRLSVDAGDLVVRLAEAKGMILFVQ